MYLFLKKIVKISQGRLWNMLGMTRLGVVAINGIVKYFVRLIFCSREMSCKAMNKQLEFLKE